MRSSTATGVLGLTIGLMAAWGLSGCSSEPDYCSQREATEQAFDDLVNTDVLAEGTDTLSENFDAFTAEVDQLLDDAAAEFSEETDAVRSAVDATGQAIQSAADLNLGDAAEQLQPALSDLQSSTEALFTAVTDACE